jgi:hypothetical protein
MPVPVFTNSACLKHEQDSRLANSGNLTSSEKDDIVNYYAGKKNESVMFLQGLANRFNQELGAYKAHH